MPAAQPILRIIPLGGVGEIGKNMYVFEYGDDIVVIDCGLMFPDEEMFGIDLVVPDVTYLKERKANVKAFLITHAHEDHVGGAAVRPARVPGRADLRLDPRPRPARQQDQGAQAPQQPAARRSSPATSSRSARSASSPFRIGHSIPDAMGIALRTPVGVDRPHRRLQVRPHPGRRQAVRLRDPRASWARRASSASCPTRPAPRTPATRRRSGPSARRSARSWSRSTGGSSSRPSPATSPAIQQVLDAAADVRPQGRGHRPLDGAELPDRDRPRLPDLRRRRGSWPRTRSRTIPDDKLVIATTGAQGEPMAGLARMANRDHRFVEIQPGDTVIVSASPIPGNEEYVSPDDRQPVQGRRERLLPHDQARPRLRPRQPGRAEADARPDEAEVLHPDPRRVPDAGPARPPGDRDRASRPENVFIIENGHADRDRRRRLRPARHSRSRPATSSSTGCRSARSARSSCATGGRSPTTACS